MMVYVSKSKPTSIPKDALRLAAGPSTSDRTLEGYVGAYLFEVFLYGLYVILFVVCIRVLRMNRRTTTWPFLAAAVAMFTIATADMSVTLHLLFRYILPGKEAPLMNTLSKFIFFITNNVIADCILLYRCYLVWGRDKRILSLPCFFLLASSVCGYIFVCSKSVQLQRLLPTYFWMTFALSIIVTCLTATRILWLARKARPILGDEMTRHYYSIVALVIESGVIYSGYLLIDLLVNKIVIDAGLIQVGGIAPTLIIVQLGLGRCVQDVETTISMYRTDGRSSSTPVLDSIFSTNGAQTAPPTPNVGPPQVLQNADRNDTNV